MTRDKLHKHRLKKGKKGRVYMKVADTYGEPITLELPNTIVRVYRPVLSNEETERRKKNIYKAAADLLKSVEVRV